MAFARSRACQSFSLTACVRIRSPRGGSPQTLPTLACLLPVRNGEAELEGYLDSVRPFADAILALDDGSTDGTAEILERADGVEVVHTEPPRDSYAGWDDRRNRQILLDAARERGFDWVLYLDADERISPDDAVAVRSLIDVAADPEHAYGFRVFGMTGPGTFDRAGLWVYRLFATSASGNLPDARLHLVPVPARSSPRIWSARRSGSSISGAALRHAVLREPASTTRRTPTESGRRATPT